MGFLKFLRKNLFLSGLCVFLLVAIPVTAYLMSPKRQAKATVLGTKEQQPQNKISEKEAKDLITKIGSLIELPKDEMPTIGTITNKFELPAQPFYTKAENGDRVLIYLEAQKAVLYRPSTNRVIEISTITQMTPTPGAANESSQQTATNPEPTSKRRRILKSPSEKLPTQE